MRSARLSSCPAFLVIVAWLVAPAAAYTLRFTDASGAVRVRWPSNTITVALSASLATPPENVHATGEEVNKALLNALKSWQVAANLQFNILTNHAKTSVSPLTKPDGVSLITIARTPENVRSFAGAKANDAAFTRTFTDDAGALVETDIVLNPEVEFSTDGTPGTYDLESTFAHEIGHLLGLDESTILGATMSPRQRANGIYGTVAWSGRTLAQDDIAGARALYGPRTGDEKSSTLVGNLSWSGGAPAFGVNVWAEDFRTGQVVAGSVTLAQGGYRLENLRPNTTYRIIAGTIAKPDEWVKPNSAYAALLNLPAPPAHAEELDLVRIGEGQIGYLSKQLKIGNGAAPQINWLGINENLTDVAPTVAAGQEYTLYVSGAGLTAENLRGLSVTSPYLYLENAVLVEPNTFVGLDLPCVSVRLRVNLNAPAGEYTLRWQNGDEVTWLAGALTVEEPELARRTTPRRVRTTLAYNDSANSWQWSGSAFVRLADE